MCVAFLNPAPLTNLISFLPRPHSLHSPPNRMSANFCTSSSSSFFFFFGGGGGGVGGWVILGVCFLVVVADFEKGERC